VTAATPLGDGELAVVELRRVRLQLLEPFVASHGAMAQRDVVLVGATNGCGDQGWGECVALADATYSAETTATAWVALREVLVPALLDGRTAPAGHPMAWAACEAAAIDADLRHLGLALTDDIGATRGPIDACAVVGLRPDVDETVAAVSRRVAEGYRSVKLKIEPGRDLDRLRAVRSSFPDLGLAADANGAYGAADRHVLDALASVDLLYLEQPLPAAALVATAELARDVPYPVALDESIGDEADLARAVDLGAGSIVNVKPGRVGGIIAATLLLGRAQGSGWGAFVGGMLETGVGRALALALASHEACTLPTDLGPSSRYFVDDITEPIELLPGGRLEAPLGPGIGVTPRPDRLDAVTLERVEIRR
jgi:o-succinylbenzoate synthase